MILEGLVTTANADGTPHLAPMGPRVAGNDFGHFVLRPFTTSATYRNLVARPEGVMHVTDDALLIARAALGEAEPSPALLPAERVRGWYLADACRYYEFALRSIEVSGERATLHADVLRAVRLRDFWGFNRAKHAVVEAAILATRFHLVPLDDVAAEFRKLRIAVDKTGGDAEARAMDFLEGRLQREREGRRAAATGGKA